jgi:hypothetical protein
MEAVGRVPISSCIVASGAGWEVNRPRFSTQPRCRHVVMINLP